MTRYTRILACSLIIAIAVSILIYSSQATVSTFSVKGGEVVTQQINLAVEDHIVIKVTVVGSSDGFRFSISCPNGTVKDFGNVGYLSFSFVCTEGGDYTLNFSNIESSTDKLITLDYEVGHYIFGIPQMLFLVLIIAAVCAAAIAVFILMGKSR
jgi:hypothetical protein